MISFNNLGSMGRLGNQMFQYATVKGIARYHGYDFCIPFSPELNDWIDHQLCKVFKLDAKLNILSKPDNPVWKERMFNFDEEFFKNCPSDIDLSGYFQTDKYFSHIKEEIIEDFTFKKSFDLPCENYISLHVRRGDYVDSQTHHPVLTTEYYEKSLSVIDTSMKIVVLSDDIEWCKNNIPADIYMENTSNIQDLYIMTKAAHNVIANSSFSWWGAWLNQNPNKIVVAPKIWFGPALSHHNISDIVPSDWHRV
jgi:hypothetical protein